MEQQVDEENGLSAMAWEVAARGKNGREIAQLHESWAAGLVARGDFDKAQGHLDQALDAWTTYDEAILMARAWCLKASCSTEAGEFSAAAASLKAAQQLAEEAGDVPLVLCVMSNRAICEVWLGDCKAAATRSRRAFVRAEAEGDSEMTFKAHCTRASCYLMAGNFLAACNEYEAASRLVEEGQVQPPAPAFAVAMDTNFGISFLRSGKPERASVLFENALTTARGALVTGGDGVRRRLFSPLALARCLFHAGEARRQNRQFHAANTFLEEAAAIVATESSEEAAEDEAEDSSEAAAAATATDRPRLAALAIEVGCSRGLCALAEGAQRFSGAPGDPTAAASNVTMDVGKGAALATASRTAEGAEAGNANATENAAAAAGGGVDASEPESPLSSSAAATAEAAAATGRRGSTGSGGGGSPGSAEGGEDGVKAGRTVVTAEKAAELIAAGCRAGEAGAHPTQKLNGAVLEGLAWSLAGRGAPEGDSAMKRAARGLEKILDRDRRPSVVVGAPGVKRSGSSLNGGGGGGGGPASGAFRASEAVGVSVPAGSEISGHLQTLQLGVLCSQGAVVRGGLGMGAGFCTSAAAKGFVPGKKGTEAAAAAAATGSAEGALNAVAAARAAARAVTAAWTEAGSLAKKQMTYATKATTVSAQELSLAHAHAGAIDLMTGKPAEAAGRFELQLEAAQQAGDPVLEALAERNLADAREAEEDLPGALTHLRRCRALAQRGRNAALDADVCRRLSSLYAEIAAASGGGGGGGVGENGPVGEEESGEGKDGGPLEAEDGGGADPREDRLNSVLPEAEIEEREDTDMDFLKATAGERALLFAERYEAAVLGLEWPVSYGGRGSGGGGSDDSGLAA